MASAVSDVSPADLDALPLVPPDALAGVGITLTGEAAVHLASPANPVGSVAIRARGRNLAVHIANSRPLSLGANITVLGSDCSVYISESWGTVRLHNVVLRSDRQHLFIGRNFTAVGASIEIEGNGRQVVIGDDCLFSSGIFLRNYDMHSIFTVETGALINAPPADMILERHVWVAQDALLLGVPRVGFGSIVAAKSLLRDEVKPLSLVGGSPARLLKSGVSWSLDPVSVDQTVRETLRALAASDPRLA